jgi:primosomal protein N' (replication factor Y)
VGEDRDDPGLIPDEVLAGARAEVVRARGATGRRAAARRQAAEPAETDPVARVLVDLPLAHLDRPFDYVVPRSMADEARPGARVKVRFAGQDVDGFVLERAAASDHPGRLATLRRVVSPEPVLAPEVAALCADVAERYAGTRADVLRLAVPPRHATTEKAAPLAGPPPAPAPDLTAASAAWAGHDHADALLAHLGEGGSPRAVWTAAPATDWPVAVAHAVAATYAAGRGALVCVPDHRDLARVDAALTAVLGEGHHVVLAADSGPARRYRDFLAVSRGSRRVVAGTRAAAFAPVADLGLVVLWDDGDDLLAEPRAPYPHVREVLLLRAARQGTAVLLGSHARSVEAHHLVATGWAHEVAAPRDVVRERVRVSVAGADERALSRDPYARAARVPQEVHQAIRRALEHGPVLVQTPRTGYAASLACERCRAPARCPACHGPLRLPSATAPPACTWCGREERSWSCGECGHHGLRAPTLGDRRTAEELGRMFAPTTVLTSSGDTVRPSVPGRSALVVATPGAEPVAEGGYAAVVLLDTWLTLARPDLRVGEEALRRWLGAAALVRPGGRVVAVGDPGQPALQSLVRWDPAGYAEREAAERQEARLPPAARTATISGTPGAVDDALALLSAPDPTDVLGPVAHAEDEVRVVVRTPRSRGAALSRALGEMQRLRSARKLAAVRVQVDPHDL